MTKKSPKRKVAPMTADPLGVTAKLVGLDHIDPTGRGFLSGKLPDKFVNIHHSRIEEYVRDFRDVFPAVLVTQAINRLTEAVRENTEIARQQLNLNFERDSNGK